MISQKAIVKQIEKLTAEAVHAATEQQAREKLTAIRALCDVVLDNNTASPQLPVQQLAGRSISSAVSPQSVALPSQKLEEADANGDSLFDF